MSRNISVKFAAVMSLLLIAAGCGQGGNNVNGTAGNSGNEDVSAADKTKWEEAAEADKPYTENVVRTSFLDYTGDEIQLDISGARTDYLIEERDAEAIDAMMYMVNVPVTEALVIKDLEGNEYEADGLQEGDDVYLETDIEAYVDKKPESIETDVLVIEKQTEAETADNGDKWQQAFEVDLHYTDSVIRTYFLEEREGSIFLNISEARADYHFNELGANGIDDMMYVVQVTVSDSLRIEDTAGEEIEPDNLYEGDIIYLEYDISDYGGNETPEIDTDLLVKEKVQQEDMIARFKPPEGSGELYVGVVAQEGEGWGEFDFQDMKFLLEDDAYDVVRGFGDIIHKEGVPAYDYVEAFTIEEDLPVLFVVSEHGLEYKSDNLDDVRTFIENYK